MTPALRAGLEAITANSSGADDLVAAKCRGLLRGYDARWFESTHQYRVLSVENEMFGPLYNPGTKATSRTFNLGAKIDVRAERGTRNIVIDHKTCSEDIEDPVSAYWRRLMIEAQPTHYMLLEWLNGHKIDEGMWDVVRKPGISPKNLTKAEVADAIMMRNYKGYRLTDTDVLDLQRTGRESFLLYEARLAEDCTKVRPAYYFQRRHVVRMDDQVISHARDLWDWSQEIITARRTGRWGKNERACMQYNRPCKFLGICSGFDSPDSNKWTRKEQVHSELVTINGDGRDVLTTSRLGTFKTCRYQHYLEYEVGLERIDEEEREALYTGTLWHYGLNAWWSTFIQYEGATDEQLRATDSTDNEFATVVTAKSN